MKYDNIPPIKGSPNIKKAIEGKASPARKRGRRPYRVNFICNKREELTGLKKYYGTSQAAVMNQLIARDAKKVLR